MEHIRTLTIFDRINLANCAKERALAAITHERLFRDEYDAARAWVKYRCYNTPYCQFVED